MLSRFHHRFLALLLPALFVFAQQAAMAHLASHAADTSPNPGKSLVHLKLCGKCLSVEKLTHAAPGTSTKFVSSTSGFFLAPGASYSCTPGCRVAYLSRAPPQLL